MVEVTNPGIQTFPFFSLNFLFFMHFKLLRLLRICQVIDDPPQDKIMKSLDWKGHGASIPHSFKTLESKGELF